MALPISVSREEAATSCAPAAAASVTVLTRATPAQTMTCPAALFPSRRISGTYRHAVTKATRAATRTSRRPRLAFGESFARTPGVVTVLGLIRGCISGIAVTSSRPIGCWPRIVDTAVRFSLNAGAVVDTEQEEPRDQCDAMRCDAMRCSRQSTPRTLFRQRGVRLFRRTTVSNTTSLMRLPQLDLPKSSDRKIVHA